MTEVELNKLQSKKHETHNDEINETLNTTEITEELHLSKHENELKQRDPNPGMKLRISPKIIIMTL